MTQLIINKGWTLETAALLFSLVLIHFFPGERSYLLLSLAYWIGVVILLLRKPFFDPIERNRIFLCSLLYILAGIFSGALLPTFWRAFYFLLLPVLYGLWRFKHTDDGRQEFTALGFSALAPFVLLWSGALHLPDIGGGLLPSFLIGILAGMIILHSLLVRKIRRAQVLWSTLVFTIALAMLVPNLYAIDVGKQLNEKNNLAANPFSDSTGKVFSLADFRGKVVVLDFWFSGCSFCFKKFPDVQALSDKWQDKKDVVLATISVPTLDETEKRIENLQKLGSVDRFKCSYRFYFGTLSYGQT